MKQSTIRFIGCLGLAAWQLGGSALAQSNLVLLVSPPGDYIGAGATYMTTNAADFQVSGDVSTLSVDAFGFRIQLDAPSNQHLAAGEYANAVRYPFNDQLPGLTVYGNGRGCNTVCGSFEILEIHTDPSGGIDRLWATFSHSCECFMGAMQGDLRYHSMLAPAVPESRTVRVPGDYPTIQEAVNAAGVFGDVVLVGPGTYPETISFGGKRVAVRSEAGPETTILAPPADAVAVTFTGGEPVECELRGFTLVGGAGGIRVNSAHPTIRSNIIRGCGYGMDCQFASPVVVDNMILDCKGPAMHLGGAASPLIEGNLMKGNGAGITMFAAGSPIIRNNMIQQNRGDGLNMVNQSDADIIQNLILENDGHGIAWLVPWGARGPYVIHNTILGNGRIAGAGISADGFDVGAQVRNNIVVGEPALSMGGMNDVNSPNVQCNNLYSTNGQPCMGVETNFVGMNGNISAAPIFLQADLGDYRLQAVSPGIDGGTGEGIPATDYEGNPRTVEGDSIPPARPDMGAYEYVPGPPRPATLLQATATLTNVVLTWTPFDGATNYVLSRGTNSGGPHIPMHSARITTYADSDVIPGQVYYYVVAGQNTFGQGTPSAEVSVKAGNHAPVAPNQTISLDEDTPITLDMRLVATDPDGDHLHFELATPPSIGDITQSNVFFFFRPASNYNGSTAFTYQALDGRGGATTGEITFEIRPVNDAPVASSENLTMAADTTTTNRLRAADLDSSNLSFVLTSVPMHGLAAIESSTGTLVYQPAHGFIGTDLLRYTVHDGETNSAEATVTLRVQASADVDRDGMPDAWENYWDLNNPKADPDDDHFTNLEEYTANTGPRDAGSWLAILSARLDANGHRVVVWQSVGGTRYRIYSVDHLRGSGIQDFQPVIRPLIDEIDPAPVGSPSIQTYIDSRPLPASGQRYYRIAIVQ
ncbi:MAG TPA: Ig-like domain-containing protein [Candidatus Paceibacterota bacterium]|nr:Ig-like domain-containing protein [Verrucomicrobiota bacterium]HRY49968.1 Ig-like domain-containing protein [Candidatus Paceibacterota bacterium]